MKKHLVLALAISSLIPFAAQAGGGKMVVEKNPIVIDAPCYDGGYEFGVFAAGIFSGGNHFEDALGGGISIGHFYNENFGFEGSAAWYGTDSEIHNYTVDAIYRIPFNCIAPYAIVGGGIHSNGATEGLFRFGAGIDFRLLGENSIFADGTYNILGGDLEEYTTARVGLRFSF